MFDKFFDKLGEHRLFFELVLQLCFWIWLLVSTFTKDYVNVALAAWWIMYFELSQINTNLKELQEKE